MINMEKGRLLKKIFDKYFEVKSPQVNLFPIDDIYGRDPYLRIKFHDLSEAMYLDICKFLENYQGCVKWKMSRKDNRFLIRPFLPGNEDRVELVDSTLKDIENFTFELGLFFEDQKYRGKKA